jgi:hypothetical protein
VYSVYFIVHENDMSLSRPFPFLLLTAVHPCDRRRAFESLGHVESPRHCRVEDYPFDSEDPTAMFASPDAVTGIRVFGGR